eukprot:m.26771 g.26771  ORF g.26771 m.26771 type:complete len:574 (-) comp4662_c0_seq1:186-1907(-)
MSSLDFDPETLDSLGRRELQQLAKQHGIKANSKSVVIVAELRALCADPTPADPAASLSEPEPTAEPEPEPAAEPEVKVEEPAKTRKRKQSTRRSRRTEVTEHLSTADPVTDEEPENQSTEDLPAPKRARKTRSTARSTRTRSTRSRRGTVTAIKPELSEEAEAVLSPEKVPDAASAEPSSEHPAPALTEEANTEISLEAFSSSLPTAEPETEQVEAEQPAEMQTSRRKAQSFGEAQTVELVQRPAKRHKSLCAVMTSADGSAKSPSMPGTPGARRKQWSDSPKIKNIPVVGLSDDTLPEAKPTDRQTKTAQSYDVSPPTAAKLAKPTHKASMPTSVPTAQVQKSKKAVSVPKRIGLHGPRPVTDKNESKKTSGIVSKFSRPAKSTSASSSKSSAFQFGSRLATAKPSSIIKSKSAPKPIEGPVVAGVPVPIKANTKDDLLQMINERVNSRLENDPDLLNKMQLPETKIPVKKQGRFEKVHKKMSSQHIGIEEAQRLKEERRRKLMSRPNFGDRLSKTCTSASKAKQVDSVKRVNDPSKRMESASKSSTGSMLKRKLSYKPKKGPLPKFTLSAV